MTKRGRSFYVILSASEGSTRSGSSDASDLRKNLFEPAGFPLN